jgi:hypothetical protein
MRKLKVVARASNGQGDTLFVEDGKGDYAVLIPYGDKPAVCLMDWSLDCVHVKAAKAEMQERNRSRRAA